MSGQSNPGEKAQQSRGDAAIRKVTLTGEVSFRNRLLRVGAAFRHHPVGLLYDDFNDSLLHVYFNCIRIATINLAISTVLIMCYLCLRTLVTHVSGLYNIRCAIEH